MLFLSFFSHVTHKVKYIYYFQLRTTAFKAYCAIWVRRSNFRHQASPRVSPCESTQRRKVELWARNVQEFCLNADLHVTFRDLLHAVKLRHGTDGFTSPPKEGVLRIFFALKIRRLRPGANPQTWVPKASTLPLRPSKPLILSVTIQTKKKYTGFWSRKYDLFSSYLSRSVRPSSGR